MKQAERDNEQLGIIVKYCERIETARQYFGNDFELFSASTPYQDSYSLCLIQIGEAVGRLSDEYRENHPQIDWRAIYGMRCHLVHGYDNFDPEIAWDAIETHVPPLRIFCKEHFRE